VGNQTLRHRGLGHCEFKNFGRGKGGLPSSTHSGIKPPRRKGAKKYNRMKVEVCLAKFQARKKTKLKGGKKRQLKRDKTSKKGLENG